MTKRNVNTKARSGAFLTDTVDETREHARVLDILVSIFHSPLRDAF